MANREGYGWDWAAFHGSREGLKWNRRDLPMLDQALEHVPLRRVAVQAGGNLGLYPKRLSTFFTTVYTFEPHPETFLALCHNAPELNIVRLQAAVGYRRGAVGLSSVRRDGKTNWHEGIIHVDGTGAVPVLRIDDLGLTVCDFLALDIEGGEGDALIGAEETIRRCAPVLLVEVNKNAAYAGASKQLIREHVANLGYQPLMRLRNDDLWVPA